MTPKTKEAELNIRRIYDEFANENIDNLAMWNWEQERHAFGGYCYLEAKAEMQKELEQANKDIKFFQAVIKDRTKTIQAETIRRVLEAIDRLPTASDFSMSAKHFIMNEIRGVAQQGEPRKEMGK